MNINTAIKLAGFLLFSLLTTPVLADKVQFNFAYIGDEMGSARLGVSQGLKEANLQGQFLGQEYLLSSYSSAGQLPPVLQGVFAIFVASTFDELLAVKQAHPEMPVFNLVLEDDTLRTSCLNNVMHIISSHKMKQDAVAQWQKKNPGADVVAQTWHGDFVKFAARDLNKRFRKSFDRVMDNHAWAGWAAVKMSSDALARNTIDDAPALLAYLKHEMAFDGQKGLSMSFRETGQLRQPLLIVENGKLLGEAPVRGVSSDIDSLGNPECVK